jgi:hypothetical protein
MSFQACSYIVLHYELLTFDSALGQGYLYKASCQYNGQQDDRITASICGQINKEQGYLNAWYFTPHDKEVRFNRMLFSNTE